MSGTDFLAEATAELYGSDPEGFTERRAALAARARAAGDRPAARDIAGLRKPTRPAWMINQLVRADPGVADRLAGLGDELRAAAAALDGARIRELSQARRRLIETLIRQALQQAGEQSPPAALREDLTATFGAALADPEVAREVAAGTLLRAVHRADFSAGMPGLTLVPPADEGTRAPRKAAAAKEPAAARKAGAARKAQAAGGTPAAQDGPAGRAGTGKAAQVARGAEQAWAAQAAREAREARAAREAEERRRAIAEAEQALAEASRAADQAAQAERDGRDQVQALEAQLDEARRRLTGARRRVRETQVAQQKAQRALSRLPPGGRDRG